MGHLIAPSILAADFNHLGSAIEMVNESDADWIHCDVMDGEFVPNISFGIPIIKAVKSVAKKPLDVHLMIAKPERYIDAFKEAGADILTVHAEACIHLDRTLHAIRDAGMKAGVALNPSTPVRVLVNVLEMTDVVCLMSVNPGFGGQKFIANTLLKVARLRRMIDQHMCRTLIEIDGGVGIRNAGDLLGQGADVLVAGSSVFRAENPKARISELKSVVSGRYVV